MRSGKSFSVVFSPDGAWLATVTGRSVQVLSVADRAKRLVLTLRHPSNVRFSPNGETLLVKTTSGQISWHAIDGTRSQIIRSNAGEGPSTEFATNSTVVDAGWRGVVEVIDLPSQASVSWRILTAK